jgi:hypothetical protein
MIFGPSGVGKTFVVVDMCLRIASGLSEWGGNKVRQGVVVYLAGEGHWGLKARVAAWMQENPGAEPQMWISKSGCNLDTPEGLATALEAIDALGVSPDLVVVDTLHRFLSGDENSSQDIKVMQDNCDALRLRFACTVALVHHTGKGDATTSRRSSALKGALESEIAVSWKKGEPRKITQTKSKDGEEKPDVWFSLQPVEINGWKDEDGEQVSCPVVEIEAAPQVERKKEGVHETWKRAVERAWLAMGTDTRDGFPYLTRAGLREFFATDGYTDAQIKNAMRADQPTRLVGGLLDCDFLKPHEHGWIVVSPEYASKMLLGLQGAAE